MAIVLSLFMGVWLALFVGSAFIATDVTPAQIAVAVVIGLAVGVIASVVTAVRAPFVATMSADSLTRSHCPVPMAIFTLAQLAVFVLSATRPGLLRSAPFTLALAGALAALAAWPIASLPRLARVHLTGDVTALDPTVANAWQQAPAYQRFMLTAACAVTLLLIAGVAIYSASK